MPGNKYAKPPIIEVILEARFRDASKPEKVEALAKDLIRHYPNAQTLDNVLFHLPTTPGAASVAQPQERIFRNWNAQSTECVVVGPSTFGISQLSPYPGWQIVHERFWRDWAVRKKRMGHAAIASIAVRTINRIDVEVRGEFAAGEIVEVPEQEYLAVFANYPKSFGVNTGYGVQLSFPFSGENGRIVINSGVVCPQVLINTCSFLLDVELVVLQVPQSEKAMRDLLEKLHLKKNAIFEECITDKARELFR